MILMIVFTAGAKGMRADMHVAYSRVLPCPAEDRECVRTRWNLEPSGAFCSTGVDHIQSPFVQGLCVGPTMKPLL